MPEVPIPQSQIQLSDVKTGIITTAWFRFLFGMFNSVGTSITDGPPVVSPDVVTEMAKTIQDLQVGPPVIPNIGSIVGIVRALLDFPNTVAGACSDLTVAVAGAASEDVVTLGLASGVVPANGSFSAWVSAAGTVTVRYTNNDLVAAYDPGNFRFRIVVMRY